MALELNIISYQSAAAGVSGGGPKPGERIAKATFRGKSALERSGAEESLRWLRISVQFK